MKAYGMDDMEGISKFGFFFFFLHLNLEWANVLVLGWHSVTVIKKTIVSKGYFIENSISWQYFRRTFEINNPHPTDFESIFSQFSCSPWGIFDVFFHENMYIVPFLLFQGAGYSIHFKKTP